MDFSGYIIKLTILIAKGEEFKSICTLQRGHWCQAGGIWWSVCSSCVWDGLFSEAPIKVSLCKPASRINVHMSFFSQRFSSFCSCRVVGYCSMKLNNNCNCTFFPKDLTFWRYSLNALILTCPWPLVHLSRARSHLKTANFSLEHLGITWANETDL